MTPNPLPVMSIEPASDQILHDWRLGPAWGMALNIINGTNRPLLVVTRLGLSFTIPPGSRLPSEAIYFVHELVCFNEIQPIITEHAHRYSDEKTPAIQLQTFRRYSGNNVTIAAGHSHKQANSCSRILLRDLQHRGGTAYIASLDIVISMNSGYTQVKHPFTMDGVKDSLANINRDAGALQLNFYLIDNNGLIGHRYINVCGHVFKLPAKQNLRMPDGFYAVQPIAPLAGGVDTEYETVHMPIEEADKVYLLGKTVEEAMTFGYSKEGIERDNLVKKRERERYQEEREREKYERDDREKRRKDDREYWESMQKQRQMVRQDVMDIFKLISSMVVAGTGFYLAIIKMKANG